MNGELVELELSDRSTMNALATETEAEELVNAGAFRLKVSEVAEQLTKVADELAEHARRAAPDQVEITLKVGFSVKNGKAVAILLDGQVDAALEVKMTWKGAGRTDG